MSDPGLRPVRAGEEFDVGAVTEWLRATVPDLVGTPEVKQFRGGASNLTYLLEYPDRQLVLRRPPIGRKASSAHDMAREYHIQERLAPAYPYVPTVVALCTDSSVIGTDFYVMERVRGLIPRAEMPPGVTLNPAQARNFATGFIDRLVELHAVDPVAAGLADIGKGAGYVRRQVTGWSQRYRAARTWNVPSFSRVMTWLEANQPDDCATCVIHNDFRLDNIVLDEQDPLRIVGVLDWEMATIGDPLMDLGSSLAYWVQADDDPIIRRFRLQPTHLPGMPRRQEVVDYYGERTGRHPDDWTFYEVFGLFRLAAIVQQIYYRYHHRQTRNPAFRRYWVLVRYLHWRCVRAIRSAR